MAWRVFERCCGVSWRLVCGVDVPACIHARHPIQAVESHEGSGLEQRSPPIGGV